MNTRPEEFSHWKLRTRTLELGRRTLVMGIVNVTPDSFSDGGRFFNSEAAVKHALDLLDEKADLLDLGAESTRPGTRAGGGADTPQAPLVSAEEEQARLLPVIQGILRARPEAILSIDTYKAATARAALTAGAEIVNDVSGFTWDAEMASVCAEFRCGVVLMHTRGRPEEWRTLPALEPDAMMAAVRAGLEASLAEADRAGVMRQRVCPVTGETLGSRGPVVKVYIADYPLYLSNADCVSTVEQVPQQYLPQQPASPPRQ